MGAERILDQDGDVVDGRFWVRLVGGIDADGIGEFDGGERREVAGQVLGEVIE